MLRDIFCVQIFLSDTPVYHVSELCTCVPNTTLMYEYDIYLVSMCQSPVVTMI